MSTPMTPVRLLQAALTAGDTVLKLLADPGADMAQVAALVAQRGEWLAAAQAALPDVPTPERTAVASCLGTLAGQQAELATQLAACHNVTASGLTRLQAAAGRVRHQNAANVDRTSGQRLDLRF